MELNDDNLGDLDLRLLLAQNGSCNCGVKTPESGAHAIICRYRLLAEAQQVIQAYRAYRQSRIAAGCGIAP